MRTGTQKDTRARARTHTHTHTHTHTQRLPCCAHLPLASHSSEASPAWSWCTAEACCSQVQCDHRTLRRSGQCGQCASALCFCRVRSSAAPHLRDEACLSRLRDHSMQRYQGHRLAPLETQVRVSERSEARHATTCFTVMDCISRGRHTRTHTHTHTKLNYPLRKIYQEKADSETLLQSSRLPWSCMYPCLRLLWRPDYWIRVLKLSLKKPKGCAVHVFPLATTSSLLLQNNEVL